MSIPIICIHTKERTDRKMLMSGQANRLKYKFHFYETSLNEKDPKTGCKESHLKVIKQSINRKLDKVMIIEDDCKFLKSPTHLPKFPDSWDILYLGGTVHRRLADYNKDWTQVHTWNLHSYIINLSNKSLVDDILLLQTNDSYKNLEIDEYFLKYINTKYKCYMITPMIAIQYDGFSNIERSKVEYSFMQDTLNGFRKTDNKILEDGRSSIKIDFIPIEALPKVSLITIARNDTKWWSLMNNNYLNQTYPRDKLEWIIVDIDESFKDFIPTKDKHIKYYSIPNNVAIGHKRNFAVDKATADYVCFMDDDDYYPPDSIISRIKLLLQYEKTAGIECVGCTQMGVMNWKTNKNMIVNEGLMNLYENSLTFKKDFWKKQSFSNADVSHEYKNIIKNRFKNIMEIPFPLAVFAIYHGKNLSSRYQYGTESKDNFTESFDEDTKYFINEQQKYVMKEPAKDDL